jgi:hypothetical protein
MSRIPFRLVRAVIRRAGNRCEYCLLDQSGQEATFHVDHIIPRVKDGPTSLRNLALACVSCSLRKAARTTAIDPTSGKQVFLFNPRTDDWSDHFTWNADEVVPLTPTGRATVAALGMNRFLAKAIRREEMLLGRHPPESRLR